jgi:hypothetical protein
MRECQDLIKSEPTTPTDLVVLDLKEDKLSRSEGIEEAQGHRSDHRTEKTSAKS